MEDTNTSLPGDLFLVAGVVKGETRPHKDTLKALGFCWSGAPAYEWRAPLELPDGSRLPGCFLSGAMALGNTFPHRALLHGAGYRWVADVEVPGRDKLGAYVLLESMPACATCTRRGVNMVGGVCGPCRAPKCPGCGWAVALDAVTGTLCAVCDRYEPLFKHTFADELASRAAEKPRRCLACGQGRMSPIGEARANGKEGRHDFENRFFHVQCMREYGPAQEWSADLRRRRSALK